MTDLVLGAANAHMAIMCLGGARAAFEETLSYTKERVQGGKLLCEHQDVQRRLAEMFINIEAARQLSTERHDVQPLELPAQHHLLHGLQGVLLQGRL